MADMPLCETYERGGDCPKSDVRLLAEHGPAQATIYTTFGCRTCKTIFIKYSPQYLQRGRLGLLDGDMEKRLDDGGRRFGNIWRKE